MTNPIGNAVIDKLVELLPCPFCKSEYLSEHSPYDGQQADFAHIRCNDCYCLGPMEDQIGDWQRPHKAWNRRPYISDGVDTKRAQDALNWWTLMNSGTMWPSSPYSSTIRDALNLMASDTKHTDTLSPDHLKALGMMTDMG